MDLSKPCLLVLVSVLRDENGEVLTAAAGSVEPASITLHELQAIEMGMSLAIQRNIP